MAQRPPSPYEYLPELPTFNVESDDFSDGENLDTRHVYGAAGGDNVSPHLRWSGFPAETKSFAVTCFDPDAPTHSGFWHWVVFDIPADVTELPSGAGSGAGMPAGAIHVRNDFGEGQYGGPMPPAGHGPHRYLFAVHAVDQDKLGPDASATPAFVGFNLNFHTIARGVITGIYEQK